MNWARPGERWHFELPTHNAAGAYADADALPTATIAREGVEDLAVPAVITHADTGLYHGYVDFPTNYLPGDSINLRVKALIGGTSKRLFYLTERLTGLDYRVIGDPATRNVIPVVPVPVSGTTIYRKLIFDVQPDAIPTVIVFRNGVRSDTIVLPILDATYNVVYPVPGGWFQTDYVQIIVFASIGGTDVVSELFGDLLGGRLTVGATITVAMVCDFVPASLPTAQVLSDGEGNTTLSPDPVVSAGATAMEFLVQVPILTVDPGRYLCLVTVPSGVEDLKEVLWQLPVHEALTVGTAQFCLTASTTHDRDCDDLGTDALHQQFKVKTGDDLVLDFTMANSADDVTGWEISFFLTTKPGLANVAGFPITVSESGVTITGARTFRVEFASDLAVGVYYWSAKRIDAGFRDDLAGGQMVVSASEDPLGPPVFVSAAIAADGVTWTITFDKAVLCVGGFSILNKSDGVTEDLVYASGNNSAVLTLTGPPTHLGDLVTLFFVAGAATDLQGVPLGVGRRAVTNNSQLPPP